MTASEPYRTVAERASAAFEVQGSEFLGYVAPTESEAAVGTSSDEPSVADERSSSSPGSQARQDARAPEAAAEAFVAEIGAEHDDATHVVPAYRVRTEDAYLREYQSDDGEPSGSAGKPALNVLQGRDLENVAVAIARYYGGTNLGVGGLVSAYGRAAAEAIDAAGVVEREPQEQFTVTVAYDDSGSVQSILEGGPGEFEAEYEERAAFSVSVPVADVAALRDRILSATSGRAEIE